jgi:hypothetical protein
MRMSFRSWGDFFTLLSGVTEYGAKTPLSLEKTFEIAYHSGLAVGSQGRAAFPSAFRGGAD